MEIEERIRDCIYYISQACKKYTFVQTTVELSGGISATVIEDSYLPGDSRVTTMVLRYPRFIHSQFMTHRVFSRNSQSSRAVSIKKNIEQVRTTPAMPVKWGIDKKGMSADKELTCNNKAIEFWKSAANAAADHAEFLKSRGLHKQIVNRVLEPYLFMTTIVTATEWSNFFNLRLADDSQPEMQILARAMKTARDTSRPVEKEALESHTPYIATRDYLRLAWHSLLGEGFNLKNISAARCARVSYLNHDGTKKTFEQDTVFAKKLLKAGHLSPFEHQALFFKEDSGGRFLSNLKGVIQHRSVVG